MKKELTAEDVIRILGLGPLADEGGYFRENYRSGLRLPAAMLPPDPGSDRRRAAGDRTASTAIYYLVTPDTFSALHRLSSDEVFHFYFGDPVEMLQLRPNGTSDTFRIGPDIANGMTPQVLVPAGVWQGTHLVDGGKLALLGTTMSPGFDPRDYERGDRAELLRDYPAQADLIRALTHEPAGGPAGTTDGPAGTPRGRR